MPVSLDMEYGWRGVPPKGTSWWALRRQDGVHSLELPSDRVLHRLYREEFPEKERPLHIRSRQDWGCVLQTPTGISATRRRRFIERVAAHRSTRIS
jgi:hypothetical protein